MPEYDTAASPRVASLFADGGLCIAQLNINPFKF